MCLYFLALAEHWAHRCNQGTACGGEQSLGNDAMSIRQCLVGGWMNGWVYGWKDGQMGGCMDGWAEG